MISLVIPAYNEASVLGRTQEAIHAAAQASGESFEVVVVDDVSTDGTAALARQHGAQVVEVNHRQIAATRNAGARAARGEMLIFVDADTIVTAEAVRTAVVAMRGGASGGGCAFRFDRPVPLYGRVMESIAIPLYRLLSLASGCFLFCTRDAFNAVGGFDDTMFGAIPFLQSPGGFNEESFETPAVFREIVRFLQKGGRLIERAPDLGNDTRQMPREIKSFRYPYRIASQSRLDLAHRIGNQ